MKINAQKIFQELVSYIEFPTVIYINETGKIIAKNRSAGEIVGEGCQNIKEFIDNELKVRFNRAILEQVKQVFYNVEIHFENRTIKVDMQMNVIPYENQHVIICFFEQSYKMMYEKYLSLLVPRLFYKSYDSEFVMGNRHFMQDHSIDSVSSIRDNDFMDKEVSEYVRLMEQKIVDNKRGQFNSIHTVKSRTGTEYFIRYNQIPVLGRDGVVLGTLGLYNIFLNRYEYKNLFDSILRQKQILDCVVTQQGKYIVSWEMKEEWPIEYVSSNFIEFGYALHDVYNGVMKWARIVHPSDYVRIQGELDRYMHTEGAELPVLTYRIRKGNGRYVWIEDSTYSLDLAENTYLREGAFCVLPEECYKELEKKYERGVGNESNN